MYAWSFTRFQTGQKHAAADGFKTQASHSYGYTFDVLHTCRTHFLGCAKSATDDSVAVELADRDETVP